MASRYAVATGNWGSTSTWAATDGGAPGASFPVSTDDVFLTATSGAITVTIDTSSRDCKSIDCTGFTGTLTANVALFVDGANATAKLVAGMTYNGSNKNWVFNAVSGTTNFTSGGQTVGSVILQSGGSVQLQDNLTCSSTTVTAGTFDTNGKTFTNSGFTVSTTGSITLGASVISITGNFSFSGSGTVNAGTSSITLTGSSNNFTGGSHTYYNLVFTGGGQHNIDSGNTFNNLTFTGTAANTCQYTFAGNQTVNGTFTATGNNASTNRILVRSDDLGTGTARTITAASVSITNVDFLDITGAGAAAPFIGTSIGDCGNNSGITADSPLTLYWFKDTGNFSTAGNWFLASGGTGGAGRVPLPQDTVRCDSGSFSAGSKTLTVNMPRIGSMDWTGSTNSPSIANGSGVTCSVFGNLTFISAMTVSFSTGFTFASRSSRTFTTGGTSINANLTVECATATLTLGDALNQIGGGTLGLSYGTFDSGGFSITNNGAINLNLAGTTQARAMSLHGSTVTLTGTSSTVWNVGSTTTGLTFTAGTSTIIANGGTAGTKTLAFGGLTYWNVQITGAGTGAWTLTGSPTFHDFAADTGPKTIKFTNGTTQTVKTFSVNGTVGNLITLQSTSAGSAWNLSGTVPGVDIVCNFLSLQDSHASGTGVNWFAQSSTNVSGNTGWNFGTLNFNAFSTVAVATVASLIKQINKVLSIGQASIATLIKQISKILSSTQGQTATIIKSVLKILLATQAQAVDLIKAITKTLSVIVTAIPTLTKLIDKIFATVVEAASATIFKVRVVPALVASVATTATLSAVQVFARIYKRAFTKRIR